MALGGVLPMAADAQVLRIGGFDFNARARSELVYSTNVERQRTDVTSESQEDYFVLVGLDLNSVRTVGRGTTLDLSTGISVEKHFIRDDLDNSQSPFGHFSLYSRTEAGRVSLFAFVGYDSLSQAAPDTFSADGLGKARDPRVEFKYGGGADYRAARLSMGVAYRNREETHEKEQFSDRDLEETTIDGYVAYRMHERFNPGYRYEKKENVLPNNPAGDVTQINHRFLFPFLLLLEHPRLEYVFSWQHEDRGDGVTPEWQPRHTLTLSDGRALSPALDFTYFASYDNYPQPAQDQIQFMYGVMVRHQISRTASQTFSITRQPVETFGSTLESDQTLYDYRFTKNDLFIYDLTLTAGVNWQHTIPMGDEDEEPQDLKNYELKLIHSRSVTRRLNRSLEYLYSFEESSSQPENLVEHRVTLRYEYQF